MKPTSSTRWAIGTAAVVAIALSVDSIRRTRGEFDGAHAAQAAVRGQLDAFKRNDYAAAYRFAAPEIQEQYAPTRFREMVEQGYPQIAHSRSAEFGRPTVDGPAVHLPVTVTGEDGVTAHVVYEMRHEPGGWRVAGVVGEGPPGAPPSLDNPAPGKKGGSRDDSSSVRGRRGRTDEG